MKPEYFDMTLHPDNSTGYVCGKKRVDASFFYVTIAMLILHVSFIYVLFHESKHHSKRNPSRYLEFRCGHAFLKA